MARIFISYRREDSAMATGRISDRLAQVFGRQHLFQDIDHIPLGVDFRRTLNQAISESAVMLVIIGRSWVTITDHRGRRRLDDPGDYVRLEVAAALTRGIPVIPVLVEGATMPAESQLPEEIKPLAYRNGVDVRSDMHFPADVEQLIRRLKQVAGSSILPARPALHEERALRYGGTLPKLGRMYLGGADPLRRWHWQLGCPVFHTKGQWDRYASRSRLAILSHHSHRHLGRCDRRIPPREWMGGSTGYAGLGPAMEVVYCHIADSGPRHAHLPPG